MGAVGAGGIGGKGGIGGYWGGGGVGGGLGIMWEGDMKIWGGGRGSIGFRREQVIPGWELRVIWGGVPKFLTPPLCPPPSLFLSRGADPELRNKEGDSPLDLTPERSDVWVALQLNRKLKLGAAGRALRTERIVSRYWGGGPGGGVGGVWGGFEGSWGGY